MHQVCINATDHSAVPENGYDITDMSLYKATQQPGDNLNQSLYSVLDLVLGDTDNLQFPSLQKIRGHDDHGDKPGEDSLTVLARM